MVEWNAQQKNMIRHVQFLLGAEKKVPWNMKLDELGTKTTDSREMGHGGDGMVCVFFQCNSLAVRQQRGTMIVSI